MYVNWLLWEFMSHVYYVLSRFMWLSVIGMQIIMHILYWCHSLLLVLKFFAYQVYGGMCVTIFIDCSQFMWHLLCVFANLKLN